MSDKRVDMLTGTLWDKLLMYALPLAATGILQQLFNAADIAVIGRCAGASAMAAVGANTPVISLIVNTFIGVSLGTNVVIANAAGRKDNDTISKTIHTSIFIAVTAGIVLMAFGESFAHRILYLQSVPDEVLPLAVLYFKVYMAGVPVIMLYNFLAAIFRGIGNTRTPLAALTLAGVINVLLNLFFVLVLGMTVDGVALATVVSNAVSSVILIVILLRSDGAYRLEFRKIRPDGKILSRILAIGVPAGLQSAVFSSANMLIQSAINSLGTIVMAASSAALNIEIFAYNVMSSFSQACTAFVGQNYGAGKIPRCKKVLMIAWLECLAATASAIAIILFFGHEILALFNPEPDVIDVGYSRLIVMFTSYLFSMSYEMMSGYMRGFGISTPPALLTIVGICGVRIFWIYKVFPLNRTFVNILTVYPVSLSTTALLILIALLLIRPAAKAIRSGKFSGQITEEKS